MTKIIEYKNSIFYCEPCQKMVRGSGFLIPSKGAYCRKHYQEAVARLFKEGKNEKPNN